MDSNIVQYQSKIQELFEKFLEPNFEIKNDTYLSRLLTHFCSQEETGTVDSTIVNIPILTEWLLKAVSFWETNSSTLSVNIAAFTLNLAALLSRCENTFSGLNSHNFYTRLIQVVKATQPESAPSIRLGYIKILDSFLEHKSGIDLIIVSSYWEDVLKFTLTNQTVYITREGRRFICRLLERTGAHDTFLYNVIKRITQPLCENIYKRKTMNNVAEIYDEHIAQLLTPSLQLIGNILEYFLTNVLPTQNDHRVILIFTRDCHLEQKISDLLMIAQNKSLIFELGKIIFIMQFLELYIGVITDSLTPGIITTCIRKMFSIFTANISKGNYENVLKFTHYGHIYWSLMGHKIPTIKVNKDNEPISFGNQLVVLQMLPIVAIRSKYIKSDKNDTSDIFRDQFTQKLFMAMCETTIRIAYSWRDFLSAENNLFEIAVKSLSFLMKSRKYFPRDRAATAFQFLIYSLKDVVYSVKRAPETLPIFQQQSAFLSLLFDAIKVFIEEFSITWRDSVETICVMGVCFEFLLIPTWSAQLVIKALMLVNVSIVKYMSPNMALLVDRTADSTIGVMGPLLITKLHDPSWEVRDSTLEVIHTISHMSNNEETLSIFTDWVLKSVAKWTSKKITPSLQIASFTLKLVSCLSCREDTFSSLNNNNFFIKLVNILKLKHTSAAPSLKLDYINLMASFLEHKSGVELMMASNFWEDIHQLGIINQNLSIFEHSHKFMAKFLTKIIEQDQILCCKVVKKILLPLDENIYRSIKASLDTNDSLGETIPENLRSTLVLIGNILETLLEGIIHSKSYFGVLVLFLKNFHLEEKISNFLSLARNKCLLFELSKIMFIMQFLELYVKVLSEKVTPAEIGSVIRTIKQNFLSNAISYDSFEDALKFFDFGHLYWDIIVKKLAPHYPNANQDVSSWTNQLIVFQLLPNFCCLLNHYFAIKDLEMLMEEETRNYFVQKIFKMSCSQTIRIVYFWRDILMQRPNMFKLCIECLSYIKKSRKYYSRERGIIVFQALIYNLKDTMMAVKQWPERTSYIDTGFNYFTLVFEVLGIFLEEFQITWRDSCETIDVMDMCFDFLSWPAWPSDLVVKVMNLINLSLAKYLTPNLALLVDGAQDSTVALLGPLLFAKIHDDLDAVKTAALEIVCTMSSISNGKFPSLQRVLLDSELPSLVVKMSSCDGESFVRATAIKCLQKMIQVEDIWKNVLESEDLWEKMRQILLNETEGIVRVEAATFMCVAYEHHQFPKEALEKVYETMVHSSTTDLHWEVKVRSLDFWDKVIQNHLQHQGMIDGHFPSVTFSREHRKIVKLTDSEIRKRLYKVLSQLSVIGCLGVLVSAIKDDCDIEVSKTAVRITQTLADLFKKYGLRCDVSIPTSPQFIENGMSSAISSVSSGISIEDSMDIPSTSSELNEEIIEQIVSSKDISLLRNVYSGSDYGSVANFDFQVRKIVKPDEFIEFTQQDLNNMITEKKNWLNGIEDLGSLLDDMLKKYDADVNNMDCY